VIQIVGLLLAGCTAAGLLLTDDFRTLLGCWTLAAVINAALAAAGRGRATEAAREAFLVEMVGAWVLALGGLFLVLVAGTGDLELFAPLLAIDDLARPALPWAGLGLLIAVLARLGLAPLPWWTVRVAAAPPAVRFFQQAGLHPVTALILWHRLDPWLLPWHRSIAMGCGLVGAILMILAAAGERHGARRAAFIGGSRWGAVLTLAAAGLLPLWGPWALAAAMALVNLAAATPRWPLAVRRGLLAVGGLFAVAMGLPFQGGGDLIITIPLGLAALMSLYVLARWWRELGQSRDAETGELRSLSNQPGLVWLASVGLSPVSGFLLARRAAAWLANLVADIDRVVIDGIVEGLGWCALGAGWLAAWIDRRGLDALGHGATNIAVGLGRGCLRAAGQHPGWIMTGSAAAILLLALLAS